MKHRYLKGGIIIAHSHQQEAHKKNGAGNALGAIQEFWTDYRTEIPVNQIATREGYKIEDIKNNPEPERRQREFDYDSAMRAALSMTR